MTVAVASANVAQVSGSLHNNSKRSNSHFLRTAEIAEHADEENRSGIPDDPSPKRQRGVEHRSLALAARKEWHVNAHGRLGSNPGVVIRGVERCTLSSPSPLGSHGNVLPTQHLGGLRGEKYALSSSQFGHARKVVVVVVSREEAQIDKAHGLA